LIDPSKAKPLRIINIVLGIVLALAAIAEIINVEALAEEDLVSVSVGIGLIGHLLTAVGVSVASFIADRQMQAPA
ncbi:MAG: hypothetical protein ACR2QE_13325, partial [Acidimicrobiales bacterium]